MTRSRKKYRVAIIGCGHIGALFEAEPRREKPASHAGAAAMNKRTKLVALVDTDKRKLAMARKLFPRSKGYTSLAKCLKNERPDIVVIATPPAVRLAPLKECARYAVPMVICEKPLAMSMREAKQMQALITKNGMTFVLNYQRRFSRLFARVRANIKSGKLGRIQQVTGYYSNGLYGNGGHVADALAYLLDDAIVSAVGVKNNANKTHPVKDVNVDALLMTGKGTVVALQSFDQKQYGILDIHMYGTKGSAILTDYGTSLVEMSARPSQFTGVKQLAHRHTLHAPLSATKGVLAHAIECYERHCIPVSSATTGLATLRVLDAVASSARLGGKNIPVMVRI